MGERDQLKQKLQTMEVEFARFKDELSTQQDHHPQPHRHDEDHQDRHDHPHRHEGSPKGIPQDDVCPCTHEMTTALSRFQRQQELLMQGMAKFQCSRLTETISFIERDLMLLIDHNERDTQKRMMATNGTEAENTTTKDEGKMHVER